MALKPRKKPTPVAMPPRPANWGVATPATPYTAAGQAKASNPLLKSSSAGAAANAGNPAAGAPPQVSPQTQAVPGNYAVAPPPTPQSASDRITIGQNWDTTRGDINNQLLGAYRNYGGPDVHQMQVDPTGAMVDAGVAAQDPNSQYATIQRNLGVQSDAQNVNANAQNNFFSGFNQVAQQKLGDQAGRDQSAALQAYRDAITKLTTLLSGARTDRDTGYRNAGIADQLAAAGNPPEPMLDAAPAAAAAPVVGGAPLVDQAAIQKGLSKRARRTGLSIARI